MTHPAATRNTACVWIRSLIIGALIGPSVGSSCVGVMMAASPRIIQGASIVFSIRCPIRVVQRVATLSVSSLTGRCSIRGIHRTASFRVLSVCPSVLGVPIRVVKRPPILKILIYLIPLAAASIGIRHLLSCVSASPSLTIGKNDSASLQQPARPGSRADNIRKVRASPPPKNVERRIYEYIDRKNKDTFFSTNLL